jgi:hypothetical protein
MVSALLPNRAMPHGDDFYQLLAHSLFLITDFFPAPAPLLVDVICYIFLCSMTALKAVTYMLLAVFIKLSACISQDV